MTKVYPPALRDFAQHLAGTAEGAVVTMRTYAKEELKPQGAIVETDLNPGGLLDTYREVSVDIADKIAEYMTQLAADLVTAASRYEAGEQAAVDAIWNAAGEGMPSDYQEQESNQVTMDTSDGAEVDLKKTDAGSYHSKPLQALHDNVNDLPGWAIDALDWVLSNLPGRDPVSVRKILHDVIDMMPDWGEYRRLAAAHGQLEKAYDVIRADLEDGMNILGEWWDGDAATAFEYHLREHWLEALETISAIHNQVQTALEYAAATLDAICVVWTYYIDSWGKVVLNVVEALEDLVDGFKVVQAIKDLWEAVVGWAEAVQEVLDTVGEAGTKAGQAISAAVEALYRSFFEAGLDDLAH